MPRRNILDLFTHFFPHFGEKIYAWFPYGKTSIRVRLVSGSELIFTYNEPKDWSLETIDSHRERQKGAPRM